MSPTGSRFLPPKLASKESNHEPPPISRLHQDVLWHIFSLNTPVDEYFVSYVTRNRHDSLTTTRLTSQVCRHWRELVLESPSLWANMLNLRLLNQEKDNWRNEVMRRTGDSPLNVNGELRNGQPSTEFFLALLPNHWTRMRILSVSVRSEHVSQDVRWLALQRPAPNLEVLDITFATQPGISKSSSILFSDQAPRLYSIRLQRIKFRLSGPWLSHIRTFEICDPLTAQQLLHALENMPTLESLVVLTLDVNDFGISSTNCPTITLPKLTNFAFYNTPFKTLTTLLRHMIPSTGCLLSIECMNPTLSILSAQDLALLRQSLSVWFREDSIFRRIDTFSWLWNQNLTTISDNLLNSDDISELESSLFSIHVEIDFALSSDDIPYIILEAISSCKLSAIRTLEFDLDMSLLDSSNPALVSFLKALTNVGTFHANSNMIQLLIDIQERFQTPIILPHLQTIVFDTDSDLKIDVILQFVTRRRDAGAPIKVFDLKKCTSPGREQLRCLEEVDGLKLLWGDEELVL